MPEKHSYAPLMEKFEPDKWYKITLNGNNEVTKMAQVKTVNNLIKTTYMRFLNLLRNYTDYFKWKLYAEISPRGRVHFHGWIQTSNVPMFYGYVLALLNKKAHYNISLEDPDKVCPTEYKTWKQYCKKQQKMLKEHYIYDIKSPYKHPAPEKKTLIEQYYEDPDYMLMCSSEDEQEIVE